MTNNTDPPAIEQLDKAMRERGWGQNQTEDILGLARGTISRLRDGRRPCAVSQEIIQCVLGVTRSAWWTDTDRHAVSQAIQRAKLASKSTKNHGLSLVASTTSTGNITSNISVNWPYPRPVRYNLRGGRVVDLRGRSFQLEPISLQNPEVHELRVDGLKLIVDNTAVTHLRDLLVNFAPVTRQPIVHPVQKYSVAVLPSQAVSCVSPENTQLHPITIDGAAR